MLIQSTGAVPFLDSTGCHLLEEGCRDASAAGVRVAVREGMAPLVRRLLAIFRLLSVFDPVGASPDR